MTYLANRTGEFLTRMEATGAPFHSNETFYSDAKARFESYPAQSRALSEKHRRINA
jgi:hypothetical protein